LNDQEGGAAQLDLHNPSRSQLPFLQASTNLGPSSAIIPLPSCLPCNSTSSGFPEKHSGHPDPAESFRETLFEQATQLNTHKSVLRSLSAQQDSTNQRLDQIKNPLQSVYLCSQSIISNPRILLRRVVFNRSPHSFSNYDAKISYLIGLFRGRALRWAESRFNSYLHFGCTLAEFITEFKRTFDQAADVKFSMKLWKVKQGRHSVAEFSTEFQSLAASSGWNSNALKSAFIPALTLELPGFFCLPRTTREVSIDPAAFPEYTNHSFCHGNEAVMGLGGGYICQPRCRCYGYRFLVARTGNGVRCAGDKRNQNQLCEAVPEL
ncbi:unnamed protein product, partial [Menidia menidia]